MPVALFIAGNFWLAAALTFGFGSRVISVSSATGQPQTYGFLGRDFSPSAYSSWLAILVAAAAICFVLSYAAWRRQHPPPTRPTAAAGAFPVIPATDENGTRH